MLILVSCNTSQKSSSDQEAYIYSVHGKVGIENIGISLTHEHIMSGFGLEPTYIGEYDKDSLLIQVVPYLKKVKRHDKNRNSIYFPAFDLMSRNVEPK